MRHDIRMRLNFIRNYFLLERLRHRVKKENPERPIVAVMLLENMGDIVACEPVVRYLKEQNPDSFIVWGVKKAYRELIDGNPLIDLTVPVHCLSGRLLLMNSGLFDEVVDLHFFDRYCSLCRRPVKKDHGSSGINLGNYFHYGSLLSAMAQSAGLPSLEEGPKVYIPQHSSEAVDALGLPGEFIVINCTSNADEKGWPKEKWEYLLGEIKKRCSLPVVEVGLKPFIDRSTGSYFSLCGKLSILESAEVIRRARLFIGIDSGPAHLANAVNTHGIVLMGSYLGFKRYQPFSGFYNCGEHAEIIYSEGSAAEITVERVLAAVEKMLNNTSVGISHVV